MDIAAFNAVLDKACSDGEDWAEDPIRIALRFAEPVNAPHVRVLRDDGSGEMPSTSKVTLVQQGFLDDSVSGSWIQVRLRRMDCGWHLVDAQRAVRCRRAEDPDIFQAGPCP